MTSLMNLAVAIVPELGRWLLCNTAGDKTATDIADAVHTVTGTTDPEAAAVVIQQNPDRAIELQAELSRLAAQWAQASRAAALTDVRSTVTQALGALPASTDAAPNHDGVRAWVPAVVSGVVLTSFGVAVVIVLTKGVFAGNETAANMLLGTLAAMATSVVSYWVGSSAGSARKDERLSQIATRSPPSPV